MTRSKIVFFGRQNVGKSKLVLHAIDKGKKFQDHYTPTVGDDHYTLDHADFTLEIWDTDPATFTTEEQPISVEAFVHAKLGVYCLDLSQPIDKEAILQDLHRFKSLAGEYIKIILVGTKADRVTKHEDILNSIDIEGSPFCDRIATSAAKGQGLGDLVKKLVVFSKQQLALEAIQETVANLKKETAYLPPAKQKALKAEINKLLEKLTDESTDDITPALMTFHDNCATILEGKFAKVMKAVASIVVAIAVTISAAILGYLIGFAAGCWTGPGAFFSGLLCGSAAAIGVVAGGVATGTGVGALLAFGLSQKPSAMKTVDKVVEQMYETFSLRF